MSGQPQPQTKSLTLPPPIDGLNLISSPYDFEPTEAEKLDNFLIYDSGVRQVGIVTPDATPRPYDGFIPYLSTSGASRMLFVGYNSAPALKVYRLSSPTGVQTDVTGAAALTQPNWSTAYFNKHIFLFNGVDAPLSHDLNDASNVAAFAPTGPTAATLCQACGYKHRLYVTQVSSTVLWWGGVDAIAGTFTSLDLGLVQELPGNLLFVTNWTYNEGDVNDEYLVAVFTSGEILVYAGDYPNAANWQLKAHASLPSGPSAGTYGLQRRPYAKIPNDILISTQRGVVSLSSIIAGREQGGPYYTVSRKIKDLIDSGYPPVVDPIYPFIYYVGNDPEVSGKQWIYALNYERGAWSRFGSALAALAYTGGLCCFQGVLMAAGNTLSNTRMVAFTPAVTTVSAAATWITSPMDFGKPTIKKSAKILRLVGLNYNADGNFVATSKIYPDLSITAGNSDGPLTTAVTRNVPIVQEQRPPGVGARLSYSIALAANAANEIQGAEIVYEELGGLY